MRILIVSSDSKLTMAIEKEAERQQIMVEWRERAANVEIADLEGFDDQIVVIDWQLPDEAGVEFCRIVKAFSIDRPVRVLVLVGSTDERDRLLTKRAGADAVVMKPCSAKDLLTSVRELFVAASADETVLSSGEIRLEVAAQIARYRGQLVHLGPIDTRILEIFLRSEGELVTREQVLDAIWGEEPPKDRIVDVYVLRLRKALLRVWNVDPIRTVRGRGYVLDPTRSTAILALRDAPSDRKSS